MKPRIYVETSVISYLAARPSLNAVNIGRQHHSHALWARRESFELVISEVVIREANAGNFDAAVGRSQFCAALPSLAIGDDAMEIALMLLKEKAIPAKAYTDALHIAIAASHGVQFIASWNFRHIAGAMARTKIERALAKRLKSVPIIATPEEILESLL